MNLFKFNFNRLTRAERADLADRMELMSKGTATPSDQGRAFLLMAKTVTAWPYAAHPGNIDSLDEQQGSELSIAFMDYLVRRALGITR